MYLAQEHCCLVWTLLKAVGPGAPRNSCQVREIHGPPSPPVVWINGLLWDPPPGPQSCPLPAPASQIYEEQHDLSLGSLYMKLIIKHYNDLFEVETWRNIGRKETPFLCHLLKHKLSDVVSQLVLIQMRAPCVVRKVIWDKVVHSLFQVQVGWLQVNKQKYTN